jgi:hypothetical protein
VIDALVFSRDRPPQLDLLLTSIERHAPNVYDTVTVTFRHSHLAFKTGYSRCASEHRWARFRVRRDFDLDLRLWWKRAGDTVAFIVDDAVFFRPVDPFARSDLPVTFRLPAGVYEWAGRPPSTDEGYPFSIDGNIYDKRTLALAYDRLPYLRNPNDFEGWMHSERGRFQFHQLRSPGRSLVGIPANVVSETSGLPHMGTDRAEMNARYLEGDRISLDATFAGVDVVGAHQEIEYRWV